MSPVATFHTLTDVSVDKQMICFPSRVNLTSLPRRDVSKVLSSVPVAVFQTRTVEDATNFPSGERQISSGSPSSWSVCCSESRSLLGDLMFEILPYVTAFRAMCKSWNVWLKRGIFNHTPERPDKATGVMDQET